MFPRCGNSQPSHPVAKRILRDLKEAGRLALIETEFLEGPEEDALLDDLQGVVEGEICSLLNAVKNA